MVSSDSSESSDSSAKVATDLNWPSAAQRRWLRQQVLRWFAGHRRDLPWRRRRDPYAIWVSEIMLQQTQVATVIDYWQRFLNRFPDVASLAAAEETEVLRLWEGLGYYRRARQMHAAAQQIVQQHHGRFPLTFADVLALPGVGRYTAGAILSIADQQAWPILEGNTQRLYSRCLGLLSDPTSSVNQKQLWRFAESILPRCRAGDFNQGLMELGSQICTVQQPKCDQCPITKTCAAYAHGWQERIPAAKQRPTRWEARIECLVLVQRRGRFLVRCSPSPGRWAGLWDFVRWDLTQVSGGDQADDGSAAGSAVSPAWRPGQQHLVWLQAKLRQELGLQARCVPLDWSLRHGVTRYRIHLLAVQAASIQGRLTKAASKAGWRWRSASQLTDLPLNVTARKFFQQSILPARS